MLFVEDCDAVRALHVDALEAAGITVACATSIAEAESILADQAFAPDLMDGFVAKPCAPAKLVGLVRAVLGSASRADAC